jgi:hypothetical protein
MAARSAALSRAVLRMTSAVAPPAKSPPDSYRRAESLQYPFPTGEVFLRPMLQSGRCAESNTASDERDRAMRQFIPSFWSLPFDFPRARMKDP